MESGIRGKIRRIVRYLREHVGRFGLLGRRRPPKYGIGYRYVSNNSSYKEIYTIVEIEYPRTIKNYQYRYKGSYHNGWVTEQVLDKYYTEYKNPNDIMKDLV